MSKQREEFETWYFDAYKDTDFGVLMQNGQYSSLRKQHSWDAWQQAQKVAVPDGFVLVRKEPTNNIAFAMKSLDSRLSAFKCGDLYRAAIKAQEQTHE